MNLVTKTLSLMVFLLSNLLISIGILLVAIGGEWDITNHLLNKPETFFSPPHALLYIGVTVALIGTTLMFLQYSRSTEKQRYSFPVKLALVGIFLLVGSGPVDLIWHSNFGLDGLLSPPHLTLLTGMMLCALAAMINISRLKQNSKRYSAYDFFIPIIILPVFLSATGFLYSFTLPFSNTDNFKFNPDENFAVVIATIAMPFLISFIFVITSKLANHKFGILSITAILLLSINASTSILLNPSLIDTGLFYFLILIPFLLSDLILNLIQRRIVLFVTGAVLGSTFLFLFYPFITYSYNEVLFERVISGSMIKSVYFELLPNVFPIIIGPALLSGSLGARFAYKIIPRLKQFDSN